MLWWFLAVTAMFASPADYHAPAGTRPAIRRPGAPSIIPGGRVVAPMGRQFITGPGPFGLAVSPDHRIVVSVNSGPERFSLTVLERDKKGDIASRHLVAAIPRDKDEKTQEENADWRSVFMGAAFSGNHSAYVSEGNSGRVRLVDLSSGNRRKVYDL